MNISRPKPILAKRRSALRFVLTIGIVTLVVILTWGIWLPAIGSFLLVKDNIQKADCIVPLGGYLSFRFPKAVELYNKGYSKNIVFSVLPESKPNSNSEDSVMLRIYGQKEASRREFALMAFRYFGKGAENIYFTDKAVTSTYEEAVATRDFMFNKSFKSLILVTSHYHSRRALMIFKTIFKGTGIKIFTCTAGLDEINPNCWWQKELEVKMVLQEYLSMVHNFIYHFVLKRERTSFDGY